MVIEPVSRCQGRTSGPPPVRDSRGFLGGLLVQSMRWTCGPLWGRGTRQNLGRNRMSFFNVLARHVHLCFSSFMDSLKQDFDARIAMQPTTISSYDGKESMILNAPTDVPAADRGGSHDLTERYRTVLKEPRLSWIETHRMRKRLG